MEYSINKLSKLAGISTRTLRYYDEINLLSPAYISESGYRVYTEKEVDLLQQILFYKALGFELKKIKRIVNSPSFNKKQALIKHLENLKEKERQVSTLIKTVEKTIKKEEGETQMTDSEKFKGLKKDLIAKNEEKHGAEAREKYGNDEVERANAKLMNLTESEYSEMQEISDNIISKLKIALETKASPQEDAGQEIAELHKKWLMFTWNENIYSAKAHNNLAQMYILDERFTAYYDDNAGKGAADFLAKAIACFIK